MKKALSLVFVMVAALFYFFNPSIDLDQLTGQVTQVDSFVSDSGEIELYFCPQQDCEGALVSFLDSAQESIHCALFDIGLESIHDKLVEKEKEIEVKVVTDNNYLDKFNYNFVVSDTWSLMHNKFCIVDGKKISTGSMNPTNNGAHKNNNNLLLIESKSLSSNYEAEFQEMYNGTFKKGDRVLNPDNLIDEIEVHNYFCPEDDCAEKIKNELKKAQKSIHFMTFSFTHESIANILLLKNNDGLVIEGVMEARQVTKHSQFERLKNNGISVVKDGNKNNMHHKVWLIDILSPECTVITGSMNPSKGGDSRNDENVLMIKNSKEICEAFYEEYERVKSEATHS